MKWPFVSRTAFDTVSLAHQDMAARFDDLLAKYHSMKLQGAVARPAPVSVAPPISPEERLLTEADEAYERNVFEQMVRNGVSELEARTLAKQFRQELHDLTMTVPFNG